MDIISETWQLNIQNLITGFNVYKCVVNDRRNEKNLSVIYTYVMTWGKIMTQS